MTRRIVLELAEDTTDEDCGGCPLGEPDGGACGAFHGDGRWWNRNYFRRHKECLAAESRAARMVDLAPEDAALIRDVIAEWSVRARPHEDVPEHIVELRELLDDHAKKAVKS